MEKLTKEKIMEKLTREFNAKHNSKLSINGVKRYLTIQHICDLCSDYLSDIDNLGNECAYTDRIVEEIKMWSKDITEEI